MRVLTRSLPVTIELTDDEVDMVQSAMNEVCNGVDFSDDESHARIGYDRTQARALLEQLSDLLRQLPA